MKKTIVAIFFFFTFSLFFCSKAISQPTLKEENLKGKVKTLTSIQFELKKDLKQIQKNGFFIKAIYNLDINGKVLKEEWFRYITPEDTMFEDINYTYNNEGTLAESISNFVNFDAILSTIERYKYYENEKKVEIKKYHGSDTSCFKTIINLDDKGNVIEYLSYDKTYGFDNEDSCKNDYNENFIGKNYHYLGQRLGDNWKYKYNKKGGKVEENYYGYYHKLTEKKIFKYNKKGNIKEEDVYDLNCNPRKIIYKYKGFDKIGNWISRIEYDDNIPEYITEREIEYY